MTMPVMLPFPKEISLYNLVKIDDREPEVVTGLGSDVSGLEGFFTTSSADTIRQSVKNAIDRKKEARLAFLDRNSDGFKFYVTHTNRRHRAADKIFIKQDNSSSKAVSRVEKVGTLFDVAYFSFSKGFMMPETQILPRQDFDVNDTTGIRRLVASRIEAYAMPDGTLTARVGFPNMKAGADLEYPHRIQLRHPIAALGDILKSGPKRQVVLMEFSAGA